MAPTIAKHIRKKREFPAEELPRFSAAVTEGVRFEDAVVATGIPRERLSAKTPAIRLSETAIPTVSRNPRVGRITKPATKVPATAPAVFTQ